MVRQSATLLLMWILGIEGAASPVRGLPRTRMAKAVAIGERPRIVLPHEPTVLGEAPDLPLLPLLDEDEEQLVCSGKRLRWQQPPGRGGVGTGFAVCELHADADDVWDALRSFDRYTELIPTVRTASYYEGPAGEPQDSDNVSRYSFLVSRIRLRLDVRFTVDDANRYAMWKLDRSSWVLSDSTGYWHVEQCADRPGVVRVWFCVMVRLGKRVPRFVIQLVSRFGLDKATRWLTDLEQLPPERNASG